MSEASKRLRLEGPSVHHVLCSLRGPLAGPYRCTCGVPHVAAAVADLLDAVDDALVYDDGAVNSARAALEAAITRAGGS